MTDTLVVVYHIAKMVTTAIMRSAHAHRVVREVDVAVVAEEFRHLDD